MYRIPSQIRSSMNTSALYSVKLTACSRIRILRLMPQSFVNGTMDIISELGIFKKSVKAWLIETAAKEDRKILFAALWEGNAKLLTELISDLLFDTISYHDYAESFYHAFLIGLFSNAGYRIESNYENRLRRSDIVIKDRKNRRAVVPEAKRAYYENQLESECDKALAQIAKSNTQKRWNMMDIRM